MEEIGLDTNSLTSEQRQKTVFSTTNIILPTECNLGDLGTALGHRNLQSSFSVFGAALFLSEVSLVVVGFSLFYLFPLRFTLETPSGPYRSSLVRGAHMVLFYLVNV